MLLFKATGVHIEFDLFFGYLFKCHNVSAPSTFVVLLMNSDITFGKFCVVLNF